MKLKPQPLYTKLASRPRVNAITAELSCKNAALPHYDYGQIIHYRDTASTTEHQLSKVAERTFGQGNSNTTSRRRAAPESPPARTANKATSMALQTRIWER
ncbi:hypothetical protein EJ02DRAFT_459637, partial [Clathrospora elynae]